MAATTAVTVRAAARTEARVGEGPPTRVGSGPPDRMAGIAPPMSTAAALARRGAGGRQVEMAKAAKKPVERQEAEPSQPESPFDPEFLESQRQLLIVERARYVRSADALKAEADSLANEREPGDVQFDEESGEGDTLAVERERDLALSAQARAAVDAIDAALVRLDKGTYGICIHSGLPIPPERLEAIPWAAERVEYKAGSFRT